MVLAFTTGALAVLVAPGTALLHALVMGAVVTRTLIFLLAALHVCLPTLLSTAHKAFNALVVPLAWT